MKHLLFTYFLTQHFCAESSKSVHVCQSHSKSVQGRFCSVVSDAIRSGFTMFIWDGEIP